MSHFIASFGFHFHALPADHDRAPTKHPEVPAADREHAASTSVDPLSMFALRVDHPAHEPRRLLGEFGLLAGDEAEPGPAAARQFLI